MADQYTVDERDLAKLISCVFLNAIKFTEVGKISLRASLTSRAKFIVINVIDTGPGIPKAFLPYLFKPFSREDDSLTRQKEGLGLGLLVAKGLARKIGGDLVCIRSDTNGERRGSEFELRVPLSYQEANSRNSTPNRTPTPASASGDNPTPKSRVRQQSSVDRRHASARRNSQASTKTSDPYLFARTTTPLGPSSQARHNSLPQQSRTQNSPTPSRKLSMKKASTFDRNLAKKHPLTFLVAEDNKINRKLLVNMLGKLGYTAVHEAYDGVEAVHQMSIDRKPRGERSIDVVLMDLWMPRMDGYEATERILAMEKEKREKSLSRKKMGASIRMGDDGTAKRKQIPVTVLAVSADVTDTALERAREVGMEGFMTKPYKLLDLEKLILEYCSGFSTDDC